MTKIYWMIIIAGLIIIIAPVYYFTFKGKKASENLNIKEGGYTTKKILMKINNRINCICIQNVKIKVSNKKIISLPGLILSKKSIFLIININSNFDYSLFKNKILNKFWKKSTKKLPIKVIIYNTNPFLNKKIKLIKEDVFKITSYKQAIKLVIDWEFKIKNQELNFKTAKEVIENTIIENKNL